MFASVILNVWLYDCTTDSVVNPTQINSFVVGFKLGPEQRIHLYIQCQWG